MTVLVRRVLLAGLLGLLIFSIRLVYVESTKPPVLPATSRQEVSEGRIGRIGEAYFNFELADTEIKRTQGLSGREPLSDTEAMVFVFDSESRHCFWMKDMKFNLDILWFDSNKKLVFEKRNVAPDTYPQNFCSDVPSRYVVEVTAGVAEKNQIQMGSTLDIEL